MLQFRTILFYTSPFDLGSSNEGTAVFKRRFPDQVNDCSLKCNLQTRIQLWAFTGSKQAYLWLSVNPRASFHCRHLEMQRHIYIFILSQYFIITAKYIWIMQWKFRNYRMPFKSYIHLTGSVGHRKKDTFVNVVLEQPSTQQ